MNNFLTNPSIDDYFTNHKINNKISFDKLKDEIVNGHSFNIIINTSSQFMGPIDLLKETNINKVCSIYLHKMDSIELLIGPIFLTNKKLKIISAYIVYNCQSYYTNKEIFEQWIKDNNITNYVYH